MPNVTYDKFAGLYNKDIFPDIKALEQITGRGSTYLSDAINVDINDEYKPYRRNGFTLKLSGSYRSIWSNNYIILAVNNNNLVKIIPGDTYTKTVLKANVGNYDMNYTEIGDMIYLTNDVMIGYIQDNTFNDLPEPVYTYKSKMPPGHIIDSYRGRLYVAINNLIIYSDPANYNHYDNRVDKSFFQFKNRLTMMTSVADGIWISDGDRIMFLNGNSPNKMTLNVIAGYGAIYGTATKIKGKFINGVFYDNAVMFRSNKGICIGSNGGKFINLTEDRIILDSANIGSGIAITEGEIKRYICITKL